MFERPVRLVCVLMTLALPAWITEPANGQSSSDSKQPVTAKITLGPLQSDAHPSIHGPAKTIGGVIDVSQPSPDKLVIRMTGSATALGSCTKTSDASIDFLENLQFMVEFSSPNHVGTLTMEARADGLLACRGKKASAMMMDAHATVFGECQEEVATVSLPARAVGGCDSAAVSVSEGPICAPISAGCYALQQQLRVAAFQSSGVVACGKATAELSPAPLPPAWQGSLYPFAEVDRSRLGYTVTLQVLPKAPSMTSLASKSD